MADFAPGLTPSDVTSMLPCAAPIHEEMMPRFFLSSLLTFCLVSAAPTPAWAGPGDPLGLLPYDARIVLHLNARRAMSRPWVKAVVDKVANLPRVKHHLDAFVEQYGIDPLRAVGDLTIAFPDRSRTGLPLWVMKGEIDPKKVLAGAKKGAALKTRKRGGQRYYTASDGTGLAFLRGHTLVGDRDVLERALTAAPKKRGPRNKTFRKILKGTNQKAAMWFVGAISGDVRRQMGRRTPMLRSLETVRGTADLTDGLDLHIVGRLAPADAKALVARARAELDAQRGSTMVKLSGLSLLIERIQLRAEGKLVTLDLRLSGQEMTRLQAPLALFASVLVAGQMPPPPRKTPPPGQRIRRVEPKEK